MAGSYEHLTNETDGSYIGPTLVENRRDCVEAIEQMWFMVEHLAGADRKRIRQASDAYFRCCRGEAPWPQSMEPFKLGGDRPHFVDADLK